MRINRYVFSALMLCATIGAKAQNKDKETVKAEHGMINAAQGKIADHSMHPDAQWYPKAGLGLFIHWGISSVKEMEISWSMIPGRTLAANKLDSAETARVVAQRDYNLNGTPPLITPNQYWEMAKSFNPKKYNPNLWAKAAKEAGFQYIVLTTKHHEGFALWPSKYGDFSTKNYAGGVDLIKPFVDACKKYGLKVGLYYSPPDWYFDRDYMNFLDYQAIAKNPSFPKLDADLNPRTKTKSAEETLLHQTKYAEMVKGQVEELLTRYGKIDVLWFDGRARVPNAANVITAEEIRKLQPGIIMNPRMHGQGDFISFEVNPPPKDPGDVWAEYCNTWTSVWANSTTTPFRSSAFVLGELVSARAWGVNYLLGVGPTADGEFPEGVYKNMKLIKDWMAVNERAVKGVGELPKTEVASVPATSKGNTRYLFAIPEFANNGKYDKDKLPAKSLTLTLKTSYKPKSVMLLATRKPLSFEYKDGTISIDLPANMRSGEVDVVEVKL